MKHHGRSLPRAESLFPKHETTNAWDLMYIVQSLETIKPTKKKAFSFSYFRK